MVTSAEQGRETRARLMDAAVALIAEHGWGAVSTRMVAERAGLRPGLVHYHFDSVNDLLIAASLRLARGIGSAALDGALSQSGDVGLERLIAMIAGFTGGDADTRVMSEMMLAATRYERLRQGLGEVLTEFRAGVAAWLRAGNAGTDPEATAAVLVATLDGLILHRLIDPQLGGLDIRGPLCRLAGLSQNDGEGEEFE
ncbi:TetR/AcrR family transcriptional regulator [Nocardia pseudobrasiliensis]|uniref:TetR family transcriptional regulator n=1 Tax=Nocardia pseudobrasiliensis TaxID=45979 RepID=A0A370I1M2_9NOCA|nr:TetR/AcrR family transcriptional regulator [Nocardia pseudobrasiliensis]RDI64642.1 TetR family transcriptional regulator [Nocardia pseudobrasiliensis]